METAMPKKSEVTFTEQFIRTRKPQEKQYQHRDASKPGLILRIYPSGKKSWLAEVERHVLRVVGDANDLMPKQAFADVKQMQTDHVNGKKIESKNKAAMTLGKFLKTDYRRHAREECKTPERGEQIVARLLFACSSILNTRLDKLSEFSIERWKKERAKEVTAATVKRDLGALKTSLNYAVKWNLIPKNPATNVQVKVGTDPRVRFLDTDERQRLLMALRERDKHIIKERVSANNWRRERRRKTLPEITGYADYLHPMVLLVLNTGLRRGEALSLTWGNIKLDEKIPRLIVKAAHAKTNVTRYVPLNSTAIAVLRRWKAQSNGKGLVFPNPDTGKVMDNISTSWQNLMLSAGIKGFRFHDLRHDFASQLVMKGVDLYRVKDLLGHSSIQMTERYSHLSDEALAEAVEVLS
jgi:integrase